MAEIHHQLTIAADSGAVYDALTTPEGLAKWWTEDVQVGTEAGSKALFGFQKHSFVIEMEIECLEPPHLVGWVCTDGHPEWVGTRVMFLLSRRPDRVQLNLSHTGWASVDGVLPQVSFDWARYLLSLKAYLETGQGRPHRY